MFDYFASIPRINCFLFCVERHLTDFDLFPFHYRLNQQAAPDSAADACFWCWRCSCPNVSAAAPDPDITTAAAPVAAPAAALAAALADVLAALCCSFPVIVPPLLLSLMMLDVVVVGIDGIDGVTMRQCNIVCSACNRGLEILCLGVMAEWVTRFCRKKKDQSSIPSTNAGRMKLCVVSCMLHACLSERNSTVPRAADQRNVQEMLHLFRVAFQTFD